MAKVNGVFKRGKRYWIRFSIGGRQYREPAGTASKEQAIALLRKRQTEIFEGRHFPDKRRAELTVDGLRNLWLEAAEHKRSIRVDRGRFETIAQFFKPSIRIAALSPRDIERMKKAFKQGQTRVGRPMKPSTINRHLALLKSALKVADKNGFYHRDPMSGMRMLPERNARDRICSPEELEQLIEAAEPQLGLTIVIAYHTAMRVGEVAGLRWDQVNLTQRAVRLSQGDTKTGEARLVPLAAEVVTALHNAPRRLDGLVVGLAANTLSRAFHHLCVSLGIPNLRFHDLRHTAATNLRRAGVDVFTIKQITGHKTLAMLERYNTIDIDDLHDAVNKASKVKR